MAKRKITNVLGCRIKRRPSPAPCDDHERNGTAEGDPERRGCETCLERIEGDQGQRPERKGK